MEILQLLGKASESTGVVSSPVALHSVLTAVSLGARGRTRADLDSLLSLGSASATAEAATSTTLGLARDLCPHDDANTRSATAVFSSDSHPLSAEFQGAVSGLFGASRVAAEALPFSSDPGGSEDRVNAWCREATGGQIASVLPRGSLDSLTRVVLASVVAFRGAWADKFDPALTDESFPFKDVDGKAVPGKTVAMMRGAKTGVLHEKVPVAAFDRDSLVSSLRARSGRLAGADHGVSSANLTNLTNPENSANPGKTVSADMLTLALRGGSTFTAILPEAGVAARDVDLRSAVRALEAAEALPGGDRGRKCQISLPRFEIADSRELTQEARELSPAPFDPESADFSGLSCGAKGWFLGSVWQAVKVRVDEDGAEAAAAAVAVVRARGRLILPVFQADRPFAFFIRGKDAGEPLFAGVFEG